MVLVMVGCNGNKGDTDGPAGSGDCVAGAAIQAAIDAAVPGDVVQVCAGTHTGPFTIAGEVELASVANATLDGGGLSPVITLEPGAFVTLRGLTIQGGGDPEAVAGGVDASEAAGLTMQGCVVRNNTGLTGGVHAPADVTLTDTTIVGNTSGLNGTGGLTVTSATLERVTIEGNVGEFHAGGVQVLPDGVVVADAETVIRGNTSNYYGGGVLLFERTRWTGGTIEGNTAAKSGAGLTFWKPDDIVVDGVTITGNTTPAAGGGVSVSPQAMGAIRLKNSTISGNSAANGGGLYLLPGDYALTLEATAVDGNTATHGGGVHYGFENQIGAPAAPLVFEAGSSLSNNTGTWGGGLLLVSTGEVRFVDAAVSGNSVPSQGGGVRMLAGTLVSEGSDWSGNSPEDVWVNGTIAHGMGEDATFTCIAATFDCS